MVIYICSFKMEYFMLLLNINILFDTKSSPLDRSSITDSSLCWAQVRCDKQTLHRGCIVPESCQAHTSAALNDSCLLRRPLQFGYWWGGGEQGNFGVVLKSRKCNDCPSNTECSTTTTTLLDDSGKVKGCCI